jgi:hypothetical protein
MRKLFFKVRRFCGESIRRRLHSTPKKRGLIRWQNTKSPPLAHNLVLNCKPFWPPIEAIPNRTPGLRPLARHATRNLRNLKLVGEPELLFLVEKSNSAGIEAVIAAAAREL